MPREEKLEEDIRQVMEDPSRAAKTSNKFNKKNIEVKSDRYIVGTLVHLNLIGEDDVFDGD